MCSRVLTAAFATLMMGTIAAYADVPGIATTNTRLHTGPGADAPVIRRVPQGAQLDVLSCVNRWCLADWRGTQGYISQNLMDFPEGSEAVDQGMSDGDTTVVVPRTYVEPEYVVPDDDDPSYTYGPDDGGGVFISPWIYGGDYYHHWHHHHHWGDGGPRPVPPPGPPPGGPPPGPPPGGPPPGPPPGGPPPGPRREARRMGHRQEGLIRMHRFSASSGERQIRSELRLADVIP